MVDHTPAQLALREKYLLDLLKVTESLYEKAADRKLTMDLLIEASQFLTAHLEAEREELSAEDD